MFKLSVSSEASGFIGEGESLAGESAPDAFFRLFGGMLGIDGPGDWEPGVSPGRFSVVATFAPGSTRGPAASNVFLVETEPPQPGPAA